MLKSHHRFFRLLFQLTDALTVIIAWWVAYWVRFYLRPTWFSLPSEPGQIYDYALATVALIFIVYLSLQISGAYKSWRVSHWWREIFCVLKASFLSFVVSVSLMHFLAREEFSRVVLVLFLGLLVVGLSTSRIVLRLTLRAMRRRGGNLRHVVLVGDGPLAEGIGKKLVSRPELGFAIAGFIQIGRPSHELKNYGSAADLAQILNRSEIDQVIVCLRNEDAPRLNEILDAALISNVYVRIVPDISQYAILGFEVEEFDGIPVVTLNQSPLLGWSSVLKRISDVLYASFALLLFSPVLLLTMLIIRVTSRGPIFYSQERMGLDGHTFKMYKFRSMRVDAETKTGAVWASQNDQRVTWVGRILRKTSLDELPQLFNVLKGDMSCVGPRPERPVFVDQFRTKIPGYMLRHKVKAGMTGWAQINGYRGNTSLEGRIEHDLYYISNWSLGLDLRIMILTVFKGFTSPHAY